MASMSSILDSDRKKLQSELMQMIDREYMDAIMKPPVPLWRDTVFAKVSTANSPPLPSPEEVARILNEQRSKIQELNNAVAQAMQLISQYADVMLALQKRIESLEAGAAVQEKLQALAERVESIEDASLKSNPNYGRF